jgi:hypothetical protein
MTMEFKKDEFYLFAAYNNSAGVRTEFRREYLSMKFLPLSQFYNTSDSENQVFIFNSSVFESFVWESADRLRVNMSRSNNIVFEFIFDFNRLLPQSDIPAVKFSFVIYSTCSKCHSIACYRSFSMLNEPL